MASHVRDAYNTDMKLKYALNHSIEDSIPIKGMVSLTLTDADGNVIHTENHNEIVYIGRHQVARIIFGDQNINNNAKVINTLKVAGGAVESGGDHFDPTDPAVTDSGMFETNSSKIKSFAFEDPVFTTVVPGEAPVITLTKTLVCTNVDLLVNEFGAFFGTSGPMFAHYTCSTIDLRENAGTGLEIVWQFLL